MKKHILFILLTIMPAWLLAEPVDSLDAKQVATVFLHGLTERGGFKSAKLTNYQCRKDGNIYILNDADGGWVLVSADDCVHPILAYSLDGEFSIDNISPATKAKIDSYNEQIEIVQKTRYQYNDNILQEWEQLRSGNIRKEAIQYVIKPLIQTYWAQGDYYNNTCPTINGESTCTGCVATAMAQVMNYWQWPKQGMGYYEYKSQNCGTVASVFGLKYDWENMPEQLDENSSENAVDAVSDIMFDCGVSVDMNYGVDGSGANPEKVKNAMVKYFKYSPNMKLESKANYDEETWIDKLKNELNNKRPILYYGYNSESGHAFICDGYSIDNSNYFFHFNWGWNGLGDGYYLINSLEPYDADNQIGSNETNTYNENQQAYFDVIPFYETKEYDLKVYDGNLQAFDEDSNMLAFNEINTLWLGDDTYFYTKIENYGDVEFSGNLAVAIFDEDDRFVSLSNEVHIDLQPNYNTINDIEFKVDGTFNYSTNKYYVATIVYKDDYTEDWSVISDINSMLVFNVNYSAAISIDSPITIFDNFKKEEVTTQEFINGDEYTCTVRIKNTGYEDYIGRYVLSLTNTKGVFRQELGTYEQRQPLNPNEVHNIMFHDTINVESGSYILVLSFWNGEGWIIAGAVNGGDNPILFDVKDEFLPDKYEDNNTIDKAYEFPLEFDLEGNALIMTIDGSQFANLHKYGDVDYYKFDLKRGYIYTIDATILNNNDGLKQTTVDDVTIEYSYDGKNWFKGHDYEYRCKYVGASDGRYDELTVDDGGNVYVKIYHPWGMKGTYLFVAGINRSRKKTAILSADAQHEISVYPNPVTDYITISTSDCCVIKNVAIYDCQGRKVLASNNTRVNLSCLSEGVYIIEIETDKGIMMQKISKQ